MGAVCVKVEVAKRKEKNPNEEFLYLDIGGVDNTTNKIISNKIYKWKDAPSRAQQIIFQNDILFSTVRTYLKNIAIVESKNYDGQIASSGFTVIRANEKVATAKFLFYYSLSRSFLQPLNELQTGSSYPAVRDKDVFAQLTPLPPLPEQHLIVAKIEMLFSELDKGTESLKTAQQQLKVYRQAVLKWAFENLPDEKDLIELVAEHAIGIVRSGSQQNENGIGVPYIKMNNVDLNGNVDLENLVYVEASKAEIERFGLQKGDILINTRNSVELVGKTGIVRKENPQVVFNNNLLRIRIKNQYNPLFIGYQLVSPTLRKQMTKEKKATTNVCALYQRDIFPLKIKVAEKEIQERIISEIESRLSVCDKLETTIEENLKKAEALRQSILKKAFEGKLIT